MNTVYIVDIEPVETRYTAQWKTHVPRMLEKYLNDMVKETRVEIISGGEIIQTTTPGAFLNFAGTNSYKSQQMLQVSKLIADGKIKDGDYFLFTDAWNPTVIQLKYMVELLGINVKIGGMWHAGSYDPADFLGRLIGDKPWVRNAEKSMFDCYDHNFFATKFHVELFEKTFGKMDKVNIVGWPMEYLKFLLAPYHNKDKENIILFPHRIAPEKQPEIFLELKNSLPEYEFIVCQDKELTKDEYHKLLGKSKIIFSANLQETLGIGAYEGSLTGALPLVPDRLSYTEMYPDDFKYDSEATLSFEKFQDNKKIVIDKIRDMMENYDSYVMKNHELRERLNNEFFSGYELYKTIKDKGLGIKCLKH